MPNETGEDFCEKALNYYHTYVEICISVAGVCVNFLNMLIFMSKKINVNKSNVNIKSSHYMYKYLALKSLCDCVFMFQNITYLMLECDQGNNFTTMETDHCSFTSRLFRSNYYVKVFNLIFTFYFGFICQLSSMLCDVAATLDRYLLITRKSNNFSPRRINYKYFIGLILSYACAFYIYKPFQLDIITFNETLTNSGESVITYHFKPSNFTDSDTSVVLDFVHTIVRDAWCVLLLVLLNAVILVKLKKTLDRKKMIAYQMNTVIERTSIKAPRRTTTKLDTAMSLAPPQNSNSNEFRLTVMVVLIGLVNIVGHLPLIIHYIPIERRKDVLGPCFQTIKHLFYYLSFTVNIFFYYHFNMNYRRLFNNIFVKPKLKDLNYKQVEAVDRTAYNCAADV